MRTLCILALLGSLTACGVADSGAGAVAAAAAKAKEAKEAEALEANIERQLGHARELERDRMKALEEANR
ncbi:hypothetical protein [Cognatazoarcus halotolerans]|uniref:hypothetical protein n=1 Tax=Cognatazoarcus halotolerans TaxID=2686016 RepID=UPI0013568D66|nr:hypothetical protein [Cognatazoarcus halotolerans]MCP5310239.1 hypothetical protein [Zoogloeaceae bacterium]